MQKGEKLGRYEIRQKIGEGGMGEVYLAYDEQLSREVVIKLLLQQFSEDKNLVARFKLEAKAVSALNHPNIITIYEIGETEGLSYIVYEYIRGTTLREKILRNQLSISDSIKIIEQAANGLNAAHNAGIIHRDIKPENIMIREDGYVKILDFGLAKRRFLKSDSESKTTHLVKTVEGTIMGSIQYMSPEQARGTTMDERTDIFSLGVVFYEMLTGISPFRGETVGDSLAKVVQDQPKPLHLINENIPSNLQKVISKALKKDREERYQHIQHFLLELHGLNVPSDKAEKDSEKTEIIQEKTGENQQNKSNNNELRKTEPANNIETKQEGNKNIKTVSGKNYWTWAIVAAIPLLIFVAGFVGLISFGAYYYYTTLQANVPFTKIQAEPLTKDKNADLVSITSDGKHIAFVKDFSGNPTLTVRELASGKESEIIPAKRGKFQFCKYFQ